MGRYKHREDPFLVTKLMSEGKAHPLPEPFDGVIELSDLSYTVGTLADALAPLAHKNPSVINTALAEKHRVLREEGKEYCRREEFVMHGTVYTINFVRGLYVPEFLPANLKRFVVLSGQELPSTYERWKTHYTPKDPHLPEQYLH